jgi:hypothetical protein
MHAAAARWQQQQRARSLDNKANPGERKKAIEVLIYNLQDTGSELHCGCLC